MDEILKKCRGKLIPADIAISYAEFKHTRQLAALTGAMADAIEAERNEGYKDADSAMLHLGNFGAQFAPKFMECCKPTSLNVYGGIDDKIRGALTPMGAVFYSTKHGFAR